MATTTERYVVEVSAKLVGDEVFATLTNRMQQLQRENAALRQSLNQTGQTFRQINQTTSTAGAGFTRMGGLFQNVSYQITDFAVQTTNGVDAMRAFSQQAPLVAGALGAAGIGGAAGIAAFAVASLTAALAPAIIAMFNGADAAKDLKDQLKFLQETRIDASSFLVGDGANALKSLTEEGKRFIAFTKEAERANLEKQFKALRESVLSSLQPLAEFDDRLSNIRGRFRSAAEGSFARELAEQWGIAKDQIKQFDEIYNSIASTETPSVEDLGNLLVFLQQLSPASEEARNNIKTLQENIKELLLVAQQTGRTSLVGVSSDDKALKRMQADWEQIAKSVRTANEEYAAQISLVNSLGTALGKPAEEVSALLSRLHDERASQVFKEMAADTETFAGGVINAVQAIDQMAASAEYLAGIRQMMSQAANEEQWAAMARLLKDAATPAEQLRIALHEIRMEAANTEDFSAAINELYKAGEITQQEMEKLNKQFVETGNTATTTIDSIGIAIGQTLSTQVGRFVDTLYDAEASFSDTAASMLEDISRLVTQLVILRQLELALAPTAFGKWLGITASAKGNVFAAGQITPFAQGGIVSKPTIFPMANGIGLIGEAGPEAIMPLSRGADGKLGVKGGGTVVNIYNNTDAKTTVTETQDSNGAMRIDVMIESAVDSAISRGRFDKSLNNLYGLRRRGA